MTKIRILIFLIAVALLADSAFAVEIEPQRIELSLPSGKTSSTLVKLTNWLDYTVKVTIRPDSYRYMFSDTSIPPRGGRKKLPSCEAWLSFAPNSFELSSRASIYVMCTINVPKGVREEHVASILVDEEGLVNTYEEHPAGSGNITLQVVPRFTIPIYVTPQENEITSADILNMEIKEGPAIGTIKTEITLHNKGTTHIRASGTLVFIDSDENIVKTIPIGEGLPIFPDYKERIPVYYPNLLEPGRYTAICTINIGGGKLLQRKIPFRITKDYEIE
jgi:hypothetical protein